jgi:hypothetical protein
VSSSHPVPLIPYMERQRVLELALAQSCRNVIYVTSLEGIILLSEGGFLPSMGLTHNEIAGRHMRDFDGFPEWKEARRQILEGARQVSLLVTHGNDKPEAIRGAWLETFTPYLTPSGREILGIIVNVVKIDGAQAFQPIRSCPLGACMLEEQNPSIE